MSTAALDVKALAGSGIYSFDSFAPLLTQRVEYLVDGLLPSPSINVLVGDSGLGKTPLGIMLGLCVASGLPFLGRATRRGTVLFCDAESPTADFYETIKAVGAFLGLDPIPRQFLFWSPNWDPGGFGACPWIPGFGIKDRIALVQPDLVIVDPLRSFFPMAETKSDEAMRVIHGFKEFPGASFVLTHHRRKPSADHPVRLESQPRDWFFEAAGAHALINNTDARLGLEEADGRSGSDLIFGGFVRGRGPIEPVHLVREYDPESGDPRGYRQLVGRDRLNEHYRSAFDRLPADFRFKDATEALGGKSGANTKQMLKQCESLGLVQKRDGLYWKLAATDGVDRVVGVTLAESDKGTR